MTPNILDGLAWAGISEQARVARISAGLVKELSQHDDGHTKTRVKDAVRATSPPHGRGKAITEAVSIEYLRQAPIYQKRQADQAAWATYVSHQTKRSTRINNVYASSFERPLISGRRHYIGKGDWDARREWEIQEAARDKGDHCIGLTHQDGYVVCLVITEKLVQRPHIATRLHRGEIIRTYLRLESGSPVNLIQAAVSLGGPKVKAALAKGKRVKTDWVGRRTYIYHDGSDHEQPKVEEIPWRTSKIEGGRRVPTVTKGIKSWQADEPDD